LGASRSTGFTLVEALIALALLAIALAAASRAAGLSSTTASEAKLRLLADCVAENRMAELALRRPWPPLGALEGTEVQGGVEFAWRAEVLATPHPSLRRVEVRVARPPDARELRRLVGLVASDS
jgi:general secretion pathway protein I